MPNFDFTLSDGRSSGEWRFKLAQNPSVTWLTSEQFNVVLNAEGRKIGDFDEQRDWSGGRGREMFNDDPTGYFDAREAATYIEGHLFSNLQWNIASGYRNANYTLPGSTTWQPLLASPATRYVSRSFVPTANYTAAKVWLWIRRRGNPPDATVTLRTNNGGDPAASALVTKTITTGDVTDTPSVLLDCSPPSGQAVTSGTVYHVVVDGGAGDSANHWEIGVSPTGGGSKSSPDGATWTAQPYGLHYRITDADSTRRWWFFEYASYWYKVSDDALLYKWDEVSDVWVIVTGHGLTAVTGRPIQCNEILFIPQGDAVAIKTYNGTSWDAQTIATGQGCATGLFVGYSDIDNSPQIWRYNNASVTGASTTGKKISVSRAAATTAYDTDLSFGASILIRSTSNQINSIYWNNDRLWVGKANSLGYVLKDKFTEANFGVRKTPSVNNGVAFMGWNNFLFFNLLNSVERVYGGMVDDVGGGWRSPGLPYGRDGVHSNFETYGAWMFSAIDAGATGTSSVMLFDSSMNQHEFMRAFASGRRIRDVAIQVVPGGRNRLWIDCGGDSIYIELPLGKGNPLYDTGARYMHESVVESAIIDMGTASRLPKYIKEVVAVTKNLAKGKYIDVDYQVDNNIDKTGIDNWRTAEPLLVSPESSTGIHESNIRRFKYRLRMHTDDNTIPPDVLAIAPNGFARSEMRKVFGVQCLLKDININGRPIQAGEVTQWLEDVSKSAMLVHMDSTYDEMNGYDVLIAPPNRYPIKSETPAGAGAVTQVSFSMLAI